MAGASGRCDAIDGSEWSTYNVRVQKRQSRQRLVLSRSGHALFDRESRQKLTHLGGPELGGVAPPVRANEPADPVDVRLLRSTAVPPLAQRSTHEFHEPE